MSDSLANAKKITFPTPNLNHQPDASITQLANLPNKKLPFPDQIGNYQRNIGLANDKYKNSKVYIVGSGIAGLATAYYFIRDGHIPASQITFLEQLDVTGGSLDGSGNAKDGFIIRGGREMDFTYENFWDMFQDIPALELPEPYSVLDEYRLINDNDANYSKARLLHKQGKIKDFSKLGLNKRDQLALTKLLLKNKDELDDLTIEDYFSQSFLDSNFWTFWRTMFAFENWHSLLELKLYMHRFLHAIDGLNDMSSLVFPKYNQYDSFVTPLKNYLQKQGVQIQFNTVVKDLAFNSDKTVVEKILCDKDGKTSEISLTENDFVIVTTGSMTEDTRYGTSDTVADWQISEREAGQSSGWQMWNNLAKQSDKFGRPEKFNKHVAKSVWMSATLTCQPSALVEKFKTLCVNDPYSGKSATGGIITITDSNWLMSFTINRQPHFPTQPDDVLVVWVYALLMDKGGNYIKKTMPECTGNEMLAELCYHLGLTDDIAAIQQKTIVRTAYMPYITSMFMPRAKGDRPEVVPEGCKNLGLVGQFVETHNDVVFTMESSVRTARLAVYQLLNSNKQVPDINPLQYDIRQLLKAAVTLNDGKSVMIEGVMRKLLTGTYFEHILPPVLEERAQLNTTNPNDEVAKSQDNDSEHQQFITQQWQKVKGLFEKFI